MGNLTNFVYDGKSIVNDIFIETGTYVGDSLANALAAGFNDCYSMDISQAHYEHCRNRFAGIDKIHLYLGSSLDILPRIINPARATTFWLDAHYQGQREDELDQRSGECPVLAELDIINGFMWHIQPLILIDDVYLFSSDYWANRDATEKRHGETWPRLPDVLRRLPANYTYRIVNNEILMMLPRCFYEQPHR